MAMDKEREVLILQYASGSRIWEHRYLDWTLVCHSSLETAGLYLDNSETSIGVIDCCDTEKPSFKLERWLSQYQGVCWIAVVSQRQLLLKEWQLFVAVHCYDYHTTPVSEERLFITVGRAYGMSRLRNKLSLSFQRGEIVGRCELLKEALIRLQGCHDQYLTLSGEPGTGKRLLIKNMAEMGGGEFFDLDADRMKPDDFIIKFDAVVSMCSEQPIFLYVNFVDQLSENIQRHIFSNTPTNNFTLAFGSNLSLDKLEQALTLTPDFLCLLRQNWIEVPPLRARGKDKMMLARHYLYRISRSQGKHILGFANDAERAIEKYDWPGNITELIEKIIHGVSCCETDYLHAESMELDGEWLPESSNLSLRKAREEADALAIKRVLDLVSGRPGRAAELLCISRASLHRLIARYGIRRES